MLKEIRKSIARRGYQDLMDLCWDDDADCYNDVFWTLERWGKSYSAPISRMDIPESGPLWDTFRLIGDPIRKHSDVTYWYSITIVLPKPYKGESTTFQSGSKAKVTVTNGSCRVNCVFSYTRFGEGLDCVPTSF